MCQVTGGGGREREKEGEFWKSKRESDLSGEMGQEVEVKGEWWLWWWKGGVGEEVEVVVGQNVM